MRYLSTRNILTDPYRAGFEIGKTLAPISPEVVILFASMSYNPDFSEFFEALYDGLGSRSVIVFGGTGDGVYETTGAENYGVSALGMNSEGSVTWSVMVETGVQADSFSAAGVCTRKILATTAQAPDWFMVLADGAMSDGHELVRGVASEYSGAFFGGLTGDDRQFTRSKVFVNGAEYEDSVAILAGFGAVESVLNAASGWTPIGEDGIVEETRGCEIRTISGKTAGSFMTGQIGKALGESDLGIIPLAAYQDQSRTHFFLRTPSAINSATGAVTMFGRVEKGSVVRVCSAERTDVIAAVGDAMKLLRPEDIGFTPSAAIIVSCAGRKWMMADKGDKELGELIQYLGTDLPLIGFPSFGEISPFRLPDGTSTPAIFHNATLVVCLLR